MFAKTDKNIKAIKLPTEYSKLSISDRIEVRKAYIAQQHHKCFYCHRRFTQDPPKEIHNKKIHPELFPQGFFNSPIHLHHDHNTDITIGAVHAFCNAILWQYEGK